MVALLESERPGDRRPLAMAGVVAVVALNALCAALTIAFSLSLQDRATLFRRDPLVGFFLDEGSLHQFVLSRYSARFAQEGVAARSSYSGNQTFDRRNVVLIVADSLRPDYMQIYGYERPMTPFLDRLRQSGRLSVAKLALATCPDSPCGVSSIMTSKAFGSLVPQNFKLHELLFDRGYAVHFILSGDHREWFDMKSFYGKDLTTYFDGHSSGEYGMSDDRLIFEGLERVPRFDGTPAFFYFHLMSSHIIGTKFPEFKVYESSNRGIFDSDPALRRNHYDNGVLQVDGMIEQIFKRLEEKRYLEDALVVILSDHGEGLGERAGPNGFGHRAWLYQPTLRIPLLIYDRVGERYGNLEFTTHVDVAPTVADRLGLQIPTSWEGRSLLDPAVKPYSYHYLDLRPYYAVVHPENGAVYKYLRQSGREELFELTSDPDERHNLELPRHDNLLQALRTQLNTVLASTIADVDVGNSPE
jgi:glucan phosphoethanolaminetransferase (alkaline phosphatase superfamily)